MPHGTISVQTGDVYRKAVEYQHYVNASRTTGPWTSSLHSEDEQNQFWHDTWLGILRYTNIDSTEWTPEPKEEVEAQREELLKYIVLFARNRESLAKIGIVDMHTQHKDNDILTYDYSTMPQEIRDHLELDFAEDDVQTFEQHEFEYQSAVDSVKNKHLKRVLPLKATKQASPEAKVPALQKKELGPDDEAFRQMTWKDIIRVGNKFPKKPYQLHTQAPKYFGTDSGLRNKWLKRDKELMGGADDIRDLAIQRYLDNNCASLDESWDRKILGKYVDHVERDLKARSDTLLNSKRKHRQRFVTGPAPRDDQDHFLSKQSTTHKASPDSRNLAASVTGSKSSEACQAFVLCGRVTQIKILECYLRQREAANAKKDKGMEKPKRASEQRNLLLQRLAASPASGGVVWYDEERVIFLTTR